MSTVASSARITMAQWRTLIEAAGQAPSPDNNQPWAFRPRGDAVEVLHCRARAIGSDVDDLFSWLAVGAAIENLCLAATRLGLTGRVEYMKRPFTETPDGERIATVEFSTGGQPDALAEWIPQRVTNRRFYKRQPLGDADLAPMIASVDGRCVHLDWLTDLPQRKRLARVVAAVDRIRFEHQPFHEEFHSVLRHSPAEEERTRDGLEVRTLELPPFGATLMRWVAPWRRMQLLNRFGMSRVFAGTSAKQVVCCGAVGLVSTTDVSDRGFLEGGRAFQRIWLAATAAGLSFQPMGGIPLFFHKLSSQGSEAFLPEHGGVLESLLPEWRELFPAAAGRTGVMLFRIGRSGGPSARSIRKHVDDIIVKDVE
ncbi:hypothetical protein Mal4_03440 [Maioricimonas rarisocia]|uniref:Nitroreductase family protein n=1 Tax=Maioricimonas rarisocia TaxID=2528026 RepID=A0A517Z0Q6_9PLAN|nr:hypothetical protein [Maioricimonas rarisocia]QDU36061.1 hypothetical protein Mal4_03440 [Maioricimonas rarisocia]